MPKEALRITAEISKLFNTSPIRSVTGLSSIGIVDNPCPRNLSLYTFRSINSTSSYTNVEFAWKHVSTRPTCAIVKKARA